ncbi:MAG: hypothetical protein N2689_12515, partial [Verrucomicrobiae bacterium]|nr:hypothetical protein [Verrucomicrobiae bacterium]
MGLMEIMVAARRSATSFFQKLSPARLFLRRAPPPARGPPRAAPHAKTGIGQTAIPDLRCAPVAGTWIRNDAAMTIRRPGLSAGAKRQRGIFNNKPNNQQETTMSFQLPNLPYPMDALTTKLS